MGKNEFVIITGVEGQNDRNGVLWWPSQMAVSVGLDGGVEANFEVNLNRGSTGDLRGTMSELVACSAVKAYG